MLEHQNMALAKQYFSSQQENEILKQNSNGYYSQVQELQSYCVSYQILLKMIYTRVNTFVRAFSDSLVRMTHGSHL